VPFETEKKDHDSGQQDGCAENPESQRGA